MKQHILSEFHPGDMADCTGAIRCMGSSASSMDEVSEQLVRYFYENLVIDLRAKQKACVLVRFFQVLPYAALTQEQKRAADDAYKAALGPPSMRCMVLRATAGDEPAWNSPAQSVSHHAIPLPSEDLVRQMPMISQLIEDLGLRVSDVLKPPDRIVLGKSEDDYQTFLVQDALGSSIIPAQEQFVIPYGVKSVLGFGGLLPSGNLFAVILFSKVRIKRDTADMFRCLALATYVAVMKFDDTPTPIEANGMVRTRPRRPFPKVS
jgi:hypothetical protein